MGCKNEGLDLESVEAPTWKRPQSVFVSKMFIKSTVGLLFLSVTQKSLTAYGPFSQEDFCLINQTELNLHLHISTHSTCCPLLSDYCDGLQVC